MTSQMLRSNIMKVSEMINNAIAIKGLQKKDVATKMGWSPQNFANRLKNESIDANEWIKLADIIGYDVQMIDKETNELMQAKRVGKRVTQMIDGTTYDTEKAEVLCHSPKVYGGWFELFKDRSTGKFFTVAYMESEGSACMALISEENAKQFYEDCGGGFPERFFK